MALSGPDGSSREGGGENRRRGRTIPGADGATPVPVSVVVSAVLRVTAYIVVLSLIYVLLPLNESAVTTSAVIVLCTIGLTVFVVFFLRRLLAITRSPHPYITGGEALVEVLAVFIVVFAIVHLAISDAAPDSYTEPLDRVGAVYFAVTVLTTVGFGDIAPVTAGARVATTIQMIVDLFLIAIAARVILGVARRSKERRDRELEPPEDQPAEPAEPAEPVEP